MWLEKEAPEVYAAQQAFAKAKESFFSAPKPFGNSAIRIFSLPMDLIPEILHHLDSLKQKVMDQVSQVELSPTAIRRFLSHIEADLKNPGFGFVSVTSDTDVSNRLEFFEDWYLRTECEVGDFPNSHVKYSLLKTDLFEEAKRNWRTNPRVRLVYPLENKIGSTSRVPPSDISHVFPPCFRSSSHTWIHEALAVADAGVAVLPP